MSSRPTHTGGGKDEERELARAVSRVLGGPAPEPHPSDERLVAYADDRLDAAAEEAIRDHLAACGRCVGVVLDYDSFRTEALAAARGDGEEEAAADRPSLAALLADALGRWWRRRPVLVTLAATAALAALVATAVLRTARPAPLPAFQATLEGASAGTRHGGEPGREEDGRLVFAEGNRLRLALRPQRSVEGELEAVAGVVGPAGVESLAEAPFEIADSGVVWLSGGVGEEVALPVGPSRLLVAVGRAGRLPPLAELAAATAGAPRVEAEGEGWVAWAWEVEVRGR